ncbi:MAG: sigma 54-interacting transcriptional regulator [Acidobacteria bacterium]|nr:sigma 54-interacting transcriptional regulator [Candidatus Sulfomarinibacter kjeldsenii]
MVHDDEFFRDATLSICGSLEIEKAMCACVRAMRGFLPIDRMFLQVYEPDLGAIRTLATANAESGEKVDLLAPLAEQTRDRIRQRAAAAEEDVVVIDSEDSNPVAREMLRFHGVEDSSILRMRLATEGGHFGGVVLTAGGADRYTIEHARLLALLEDPFTIALANTLVHREVLRLRDRWADDNLYLNRELLRISGDEIVGADFGLRDVMRQVRQVAPTESPVLLSGETGVGKDVIALDSELFGHEKGAFTGALSKKRGRFERADGGTILLDEIGEMPLEAQVRLLRVIQHREIERVGGMERLPVDIRIIAATNKNLPAMVRSGRFREDLWFRLNVFPIAVPPLRDRPSDIPALVQHFIERKAGTSLNEP